MKFPIPSKPPRNRNVLDRSIRRSFAFGFEPHGSLTVDVRVNNCNSFLSRTEITGGRLHHGVPSNPHTISRPYIYISDWWKFATNGGRCRCLRNNTLSQYYILFPVHSRARLPHLFPLFFSSFFPPLFFSFRVLSDGRVRGGSGDARPFFLFFIYYLENWRCVMMELK